MGAAAGAAELTDVRFSVPESGGRPALKDGWGVGVGALKEGIGGRGGTSASAVSATGGALSAGMGMGSAWLGAEVAGLKTAIGVGEGIEVGVGSGVTKAGVTGCVFCWETVRSREGTFLVRWSMSTMAKTGVPFLVTT
jgi:hypothetical protein